MDGYTLLIGIGASLGILRIYQTAPLELRNEYVNDGLLVQFFILIGARLGYVFLRWAYYREIPVRVFQFFDGGLSLWGAILGALLGFIVVLLISDRGIFQVADALTPMLPPLTICAWLASWQAGIAYGDTLSDQIWWAVPGPEESGLIAARVPLQFIAAAAVLLPFAWLEIKQPFSGIIGMQASASVIFFAAITALFTLQRADPGLFWGRFRPEIWVSLGLLALGLLGFMIITVREYRRG